MYGKMINPPYEIFKKMASGKVIDASNLEDIHNFFAELEEAHCFADGAGTLDKIMSPDRLQELVMLRAPFLIDAYIPLLQRSLTAKEDLVFDDLVSMVLRHIENLRLTRSVTAFVPPAFSAAASGSNPAPTYAQVLANGSIPPLMPASSPTIA